VTGGGVGRLVDATRGGRIVCAGKHNAHDGHVGGVEALHDEGAAARAVVELGVCRGMVGKWGWGVLGWAEEGEGGDDRCTESSDA
jgi:hypothetical protein